MSLVNARAIFQSCTNAELAIGSYRERPGEPLLPTFAGSEASVAGDERRMMVVTGKAELNAYPAFILLQRYSRFDQTDYVHVSNARAILTVDDYNVSCTGQRRRYLLSHRAGVVWL